MYIGSKRLLPEAWFPLASKGRKFSAFLLQCKLVDDQRTERLSLRQHLVSLRCWYSKSLLFLLKLRVNCVIVSHYGWRFGSGPVITVVTQKKSQQIESNYWLAVFPPWPTCTNNRNVSEYQSRKISTGHSNLERLLHALFSDWHEPVLQELNEKIEEDMPER